ncbi:MULTISPECIES: hypothetical protein [unclassified Streptomyces]|uniref:hypothetical protein n=1 Tax=unclassified Streptomyces TaxID=2593676 RepID=UPI00136E2FBE|nr:MULTISPECIES: hypothetical protein [unclassified Streptomyces]NDZ98747.1 hypothetical protein [Streptomyces sp. SID10116]MYY83391.1 hypothetical protein [Streptomyces sp. SID335]MYZ15729.1 hypothetical protein [Streptomyces sp. SID337]NDZ84771.1 hypothetical protein [Streptomyces sp. SID10115]NEB43036.1 hypothetical protein [Streptomyces sp. SID339]
MYKKSTPQAGAPGTGLNEEQAATEARRIIDDAYRPTAYRDPSPVPAHGDAPAISQPGRPPMSQGATDASVLLLAGGTTTVMVGGTAGVLMYVSQFADPIVCGLVFGAPSFLVLALARLARRAKPAPDIHHHYAGPVHQDRRTVHSRTSGVWAKTSNQP